MLMPSCGGDTTVSILWYFILRSPNAAGLGRDCEDGETMTQLAKRRVIRGQLQLQPLLRALAGGSEHVAVRLAVGAQDQVSDGVRRTRAFYTYKKWRALPARGNFFRVT